MIIEARWHNIKHGYIYRFNRPRVDLVALVPGTRVVPEGVYKLDVFMIGMRRLGLLCWRKAFRKEWDDIGKKGVDLERISHYHANPVGFVCSLYVHLSRIWGLAVPDQDREGNLAQDAR